MKRKLWCAAIIIVAVWWWHHRDPVQRSKEVLQAAVTADGFAVLHRSDDRSHDVREMTRGGQHVKDYWFADRGETRVVGTRQGAAIGWLEDNRIRLITLADHHDLGTWGKRVRRMCDGVASNAQRFGIAWLEADNSMWMVHGPTASTLAIADAGAAPSWCGIASADQNIALLWREGDRLKFNMCSKARCSSTVTSTAFDRRLALLGFGCLESSCAFVSRDQHGNTKLTYVVGSGSARWSTPIESDAPRVAVVGIADRAFAVGYEHDGGSEVIVVDKKGQRRPAWSGPMTAPMLAWAPNALLVAYIERGELRHRIVEDL